MGKSAWCDLKKDGILWNLLDMCLNSKCNCQKQVNFTPKQLQLEGNGYKNTMRKTIDGSQKVWDKLSKAAVNTLAPVIGMAVGAKRASQATTKKLSRRYFRADQEERFSLIDMHWIGLRLRVL